MSVEFRPLPKEPDAEERKKNKLKSKSKSALKKSENDKPNISHPTNFKHDVHVGFDPISGEFTVCCKGQRGSFQNLKINGGGVAGTLIECTWDDRLFCVHVYA